jgi:hypothetical protein
MREMHEKHKEEMNDIDKTLFDFDDDIDKLSDVEDRWPAFG